MRATAPILIAALMISCVPVPASAKGSPKKPHVSAPKLPQHRPPKMPAYRPPRPAHVHAPTPHAQAPKAHAAGPQPHATHLAVPSRSIHYAPRYSVRSRRGYFARSYGRRYARGYGPRRYPIRRNPQTVLAQARLRRLARLKQDLEDFRPGSMVTPAQKGRLAADLMAVAEGPARPGKAPVQHLASDLAEAMGRRRPGPLNAEALAVYLGSLMNGAHTPSAAVRPGLARGTSLLRAAGVEPMDAEALTDGFRDILAALNPGLAAGRLR